MEEVTADALGQPAGARPSARVAQREQEQEWLLERHAQLRSGQTRVQAPEVERVAAWTPAAEPQGLRRQQAQALRFPEAAQRALVPVPGPVGK